jgi:glycosyltransferase involved in cell wall biosynthesis
MLAGAATVAADAGGVPEMISDSKAGFRTPPGDSAELAAVIEGLLSTTESPRQRFGLVARQTALKLTESAVIERQIAEIYGSLSAVHRHPFPGLASMKTEGAPS